MQGKRSLEVESGQTSQIIEKVNEVIGKGAPLTPLAIREVNSPTIFASPFQRRLPGFFSIRARQIRFVDLYPAHPAAPVAVRRWFSRRHIIERAGGNNHTLAVTRCVGNRAIAVAADLPREAFRLRKIETFDQILPLGPAKLSDGYGDVRGAHSTCGFAATRAVAMPKPGERRAHLVANRLT